MPEGTLGVNLAVRAGTAVGGRDRDDSNGLGGDLQEIFPIRPVYGQKLR